MSGVRMEYTGTQAGPISFSGADRTRTYRGAANATNKYADVHPDDVPVLAATGRWKEVPPLALAEATGQDTLSTTDAAAMLGLADGAAVRALIDDGQLVAEKDERGHYQIAPATLLAYQERLAAQAAQTAQTDGDGTEA